MPDRPSWTPLQTADGSFTFFSEEFGEAFHSRQGASEESFRKFVAVTDLVQKAQKSHLRLLDVCYGLGYNTAAALETIWRINPNCKIEMYGLEVDTTVPLAAILPPLIDRWSPEVQTILKSLAENHHSQTSQITGHLLIGDARQTIQKLQHQEFQADAIFFDPFSPRRCPQLWTVEFFMQVARCLSPDGKLATYSRAASVRSALKLAGFQLGTIPLNAPSPLSHEWSQGTVGAFTDEGLQPLSPMEQEHLQTRAAIPYRDPSLSDTVEEILGRHEQEQQNSPLEPTTQWRRRWGIQ